MAIPAYNELYVNNARTTMATMLDFAVNYKHEQIDLFFAEFITSGIARMFGLGDPAIIMGKTGIDLYYDVKKQYIGNEFINYQSINRSPEFWLGSYLAFSQWYLNRTFQEITFAVSLSEMLSWYSTDHEADVVRFADKLELRIIQSNNNLKTIRNRNGLSQSALANLSGVGLRNIQMFEQGKNDISKAQNNTLAALSRRLNCDQQDLVQIIDFKQKLISDYEKNLRELNQLQAQLEQSKIIRSYINQFPYNDIAYYQNNYYGNRKLVNNNFNEFWKYQAQQQIENEKMREVARNQIQQQADLVASLSDNKTLQMTTDAFGLLNSKNIFEAAYRVLSIINNATKK